MILTFLFTKKECEVCPFTCSWCEGSGFTNKKRGRKHVVFNFDWLDNISTSSTSDNPSLAERDAAADGANEEQNDGLQYDPTSSSGNDSNSNISSNNSSNNNENEAGDGNDGDGGGTTNGNVTLF